MEYHSHPCYRFDQDDARDYALEEFLQEDCSMPQLYFYLSSPYAHVHLHHHVAVPILAVSP